MLVFVLAVAVHSVFLLWGWCISCWLLLWGGNFGDGCGSAVCCAILKLVFVVLAAAVH